MTARTIKVKRHKPSLSERLRLKGVAEGLLNSGGALLRSWLARKENAAGPCPEASAANSEVCRGLHRLLIRADGTIQCVACMLCATHCPARCIFIVAQEQPDGSVQRMPARFEIDLLKCLFCGMCEETCPSDAIRLDTGLQASSAAARSEATACLEELLARSARANAEESPRDT